MWVAGEIEAAGDFLGELDRFFFSPSSPGPISGRKCDVDPDD